MFQGIYENKSESMVCPKLLTTEEYAWLKEQYQAGKRIFVIITKDSVEGKWLDGRRALGCWKIPEEEEKLLIMQDYPAHIGVLVIQKKKFSFVDCNNFEEMDENAKQKFKDFYRRVRTQVANDFKEQLGLSPDERKKFRVKRLVSRCTYG